VSATPSGTLAVNRRARHDYLVVDTLECGIELRGTEVKSMRARHFAFADAYARVQDDQLFLSGLHVNTYPQGNQFNHDPDRTRRLLAHKQEIRRLRRRVDEKGLTLIPLRFYLKHGLVKCELGVCRGKRAPDKREDIKRRDQDRDSERELRRFSK